jgi:hypothetical protein
MHLHQRGKLCPAASPLQEGGVRLIGKGRAGQGRAEQGRITGIVVFSRSTRLQPLTAERVACDEGGEGGGALGVTGAGCLRGS